MPYDPKISIKKFFTGLVYTGIPFLIGYTIDFLETEEFPPEYAIYITLATGILHLLANTIKHWND